jgi:hypothetical protein
MCGIYYWVSEQRGGEKFKPEFKDVLRKIQFIRNEEQIIKSCKYDSEYAYKKATYALG